MNRADTPSQKVHVGILSERDAFVEPLTQRLNRRGMRVSRLTDPCAPSPSAARLDVCIVRASSVDTLRRLRERFGNLSILAIVRSRKPEHRSRWLEAGADDCLSLPLHMVELAARIKVLARRRSRSMLGRAGVCIGRVRLHFESRDAYLDEIPLTLTSHEFDLLAALARSAGRVLSRERLLQLTRGATDETFDRSIDVQVSRLRAKLQEAPRRPSIIKTVRGRGYLMHGGD